MTVTVSRNAKFEHLNADRSYAIKVGGVGVEREMVVDIVITGATDFTTGQATVDFTQVNFKQVYSCIIEQNDDWDLNVYQFIEAAASDAATAKIEGRVRTTSVAVADATVVTLQAIIRGV